MFLLLDQIQDMMNKHLAYFEDKFKAELEKREEILNEKIKSLEQRRDCHYGTRTDIPPFSHGT